VRKEDHRQQGERDEPVGDAGAAPPSGDEAVSASMLKSADTTMVPVRVSHAALREIAATAADGQRFLAALDGRPIQFRHDDRARVAAEDVNERGAGARRQVTHTDSSGLAFAGPSHQNCSA
jgi:hypothetical protein